MRQRQLPGSLCSNCAGDTARPRLCVLRVTRYALILLAAVLLHDLIGKPILVLPGGRSGLGGDVLAIPARVTRRPIGAALDTVKVPDSASARDQPRTHLNELANSGAAGVENR
jgi:hypothetical protein